MVTNKRQRSNQRAIVLPRNLTSNFRVKDPTTCPNCGLGAEGLSQILELFGLRTMSDGVVRVQSWCKECRQPPRKHQL